MARQKMYVVMGGVMRAKWIDLKDIHDKPDVLFSLPIPPTEEIAAPVKEENSKILMVADEPGGLRHPVDRETGKPPAEEEAAAEDKGSSKAKRKYTKRNKGGRQK